MSLLYKRLKVTCWASVDPPLPLPNLSRDEFNGYKKTILQEYLYDLLLKTDQEFSTDSADEITGALQPFKQLVPKFLEEVAYRDYTDSVSRILES